VVKIRTVSFCVMSLRSMVGSYQPTGGIPEHRGTMLLRNLGTHRCPNKYHNTEFRYERPKEY
jgi:hypothetical protein